MAIFADFSKLSIKMQVLLAVLAIIVIGLLVWELAVWKPGPKAIAVPGNLVPARFPDGIPFFGEHQILANSYYQNGNLVEFDRKFVASSTPDEEYGLYLSYLPKQGWQLSPGPAVPSGKSMQLKKGGTIGSIIIEPSSNAALVSIHFSVPE